MDKKKFTAHIDDMKNIQTIVLEFLEKEDIDDYETNDMIQELKSLKSEKQFRNKIRFKEILNMILKIAKNHQRTPNFKIKIEQIIKILEDEIKFYFNNFDIFNIFKGDKSILLFLFEEKIIIPDQFILSYIKDKTKYLKRNYLEFLSIEFNLKCHEEDIDIFKTKRKNGENDSYICELIRNDSVDDFIIYVNSTNICLNSKINQSIYETNLFLLKNQPTLIEYAAFFGSIQIFHYLLTNEADIKPNIWLFAIHSQNPELIQILEDNQIEPIKLNFRNEYIESIKCHHNNIMQYIENNYLIKEIDEYIIFTSFKSFNFINFTYEFKDIIKLIDFDFFKQIIHSDQIIVFHTILHKIMKKKIRSYEWNKFNDVYFIKKLFHEIVINNKTEIAEIFLSHWCSEKIHERSIYSKYKPELIIAIEQQNVSMIQVLMSHSHLNINESNVTTFNGIEIEKFPLHVAIENGNIEILKILLDNEKTNNNSVKYIETNKEHRIEKGILHYAIDLDINNKSEIIQLLLQHHNIDVNFCSLEKNIETGIAIRKSLLMIAAENNNIEIAKLLLQKEECDINLLELNDNVKKNALRIAVEKGFKEMVQVLISNPKTEINYIYKDEKNALSIAIEKEDIDIIKILLSREDIDVNYQLKDKHLISNAKTYIVEKTALSMAIDIGNIEIMKLLLENNNININYMIKEYNENKISYKYIKKKKPLNNTQKSSKEIIKRKTYLHYAVINQKCNIISLLLDHGIDINKKDEKGLNATEYGDDNIKKILSSI